MLQLARHGVAFVTLSVVASGCSCDSDETASGGGGTTTATTAITVGVGGAGGEGGMGGTGGGYVCMPGEGTVFALTELRFGEGTNGEWKSIGMNIDGLVSDGSSTDVCQPNSGGNPNFAHPDGDNGIDNAFGKSLLPLINSVSPNFETLVNQYLDEGRFNAMMKVLCIPPTGDATNLTTKVFGGTDLGHTPAFNGTDVWPVAPELLADPQDPESSTLIFPASSVIDNTFDSGPNVEFVLSIPLAFNNQEQVLKLSLHSARLILTLAEDRKSGSGVLAGVLNTEEAIDQAKKIAFMADLCNDPMYDAAITAIRQMSDILTDGTQDPALTCDGISFGVEFDMREIQIGDVGPPAPPSMACP